MKKVFDNFILKTIFKIFSLSYLFLLIIYLMAISFQGLSNNMSIFGYKLFTVSNSSMRGVYDCNDVVLVKSINNNKLKIKDDIVYNGERGGLNKTVVISRISKISKSEITTKGVNSTFEDPAIKSGNVIGKVVLKVPLITQINHIVNDERNLFLFGFLPLFLIISLEIIKTLLDIKEEKQEKNKFYDEPVIIATIDSSLDEEKLNNDSKNKTFKNKKKSTDKVEKTTSENKDKKKESSKKAKNKKNTKESEKEKEKKSDKEIEKDKEKSSSNEKEKEKNSDDEPIIIESMEVEVI